MHLNHKSLFIALILLACSWAGCSSTKTLNNPTTSATLWVQNSAEYKALTTMVYQSAGARLDTVLNAADQTAELSQQKNAFSNLPPAIILDVDETILDNSPFQARLIKNHENYTSEKWNRWVREEKAAAIAGAVTFTQKAAQKGITIFYITNRDAAVEDATVANLKKRGFPLKKDNDVVLTKNEKPGWTSAKENRRKFVAKNYHILMLFGDNLNDLLPADNITNSERKKLVNKYKQRFGTQWFIIPNPTYGSWQKALYDFDDTLTPAQIERQRINMLHTKN